MNEEFNKKMAELMATPRKFELGPPMFWCDICKKFKPINSQPRIGIQVCKDCSTIIPLEE
ncbi:hypothetical protein IAQ67_14800 [Paenibacillus peoriae]|uniref:Uncharacterized protein n=1 Tax=Paenibacillus peoriae TaxID=59893 RepID=A0A7H0Y275_9BACL|nr:hypothetical protein [Paenibacillus peoriae]QNR65183.1 hypothetical protein IAQ67_14800 [Paenibacillus peoriae]